MNIVKPLFVIVFLSKGLAEPNNYHNHRADRRNNYFNSDEVFWNNIEWDSNPRLQNHNLVYSPRWNSPARRLPWRMALRKRKQELANANAMTTNDPWAVNRGKNARAQWEGEGRGQSYSYHNQNHGYKNPNRAQQIEDDFEVWDPTSMTGHAGVKINKKGGGGDEGWHTPVVYTTPKPITEYVDKDDKLYKVKENTDKKKNVAPKALVLMSLGSALGNAAYTYKQSERISNAETSIAANQVSIAAATASGSNLCIKVNELIDVAVILYNDFLVAGTVPGIPILPQLTAAYDALLMDRPVNMMIDLAEIVYNDLLTLGGGGIPIPQATKTAFEKLIASRAIC